MGRRSKAEQRIRRNPKGVRLDELLGVLRAAGFDTRLGRRGHWTCSHPSGTGCTLPNPHGRGDTHLLPEYVEQGLRALDGAREWESEQESDRES
jgi:hypothetical protein